MDDEAVATGNNIKTTSFHEDTVFNSKPSKKAKARPIIEEHYDDCCTDLTPILYITADISDDEFDKQSMLLDSCLFAADKLPFLDDATIQEIRKIENYSQRVFDPSFPLWHFLGSEYTQVTPDPLPECIKAFATIYELETFTEQCMHSDTKQQLDVVEICGGVGGVLQLAIRKQMKAGINFDLRTGIDLNKQSEIDKLWAYLTRHRPRVIVGAPPCTAFGSWAKLNKQRAPEAWALSMAIGKPLANLLAYVALWQLDSDRDFIVENPQSSELWDLPLWQKILNHASVHSHLPSMHGWSPRSGGVTLLQTHNVCRQQGMLSQKIEIEM